MSCRIVVPHLLQHLEVHSWKAFMSRAEYTLILGLLHPKHITAFRTCKSDLRQGKNMCWLKIEEVPAFLDLCALCVLFSRLPAFPILEDGKEWIWMNVSAVFLDFGRSSGFSSAFDVLYVPCMTFLYHCTFLSHLHLQHLFSCVWPCFTLFDFFLDIVFDFSFCLDFASGYHILCSWSFDLLPHHWHCFCHSPCTPLLILIKQSALPQMNTADSEHLHGSLLIQRYYLGNRNPEFVPSPIKFNSSQLELSQVTARLKHHPIPRDASKPEKYNGDPAHCQGFLFQCQLYFEAITAGLGLWVTTQPRIWPFTIWIIVRMPYSAKWDSPPQRTLVLLLRRKKKIISLPIA